MSNDEKTESTPSLMQALANVPASDFWQSTREELQSRKPNYNKATAAVLREVFPGVKSAADLIEAISKGERLNFSSVQRAVAKEAKRRKNPGEKKAPKAPKAAKGKKSAKKSKLL